LGEARAISNEDLALVKDTINKSGATSLKASISALNSEANRVDAFNSNIVQSPEQVFQSQAPNPDPFTGEVTAPGKPFTTPNFLQTPSSPQGGTGTPSLQGLDDFLRREDF
jgi:hypothetical protein